MRTLFMIVALALGTISVQAQENCKTPEVKAGDMLKIASPSHSSYDHINFPKSNFIIKQGGIANYRGLINEEVEVTKVTMKDGCIASVAIQRTDGKKFFNTVKVVTVDLEKALAAGEVTVK